MRRSIPFVAVPVLFALTLACTLHKGGMPKDSYNEITFMPEGPALTLLPIPTELEEPHVPTLAKLGEAAVGGGVSLTALQVIDPATPKASYTLEEGKRLVAVEVVIANVSAAKPVAVSAYSFSARDTEGNDYVADLFGVDNLIATVKLGDGEKIQGWAAFAIPVSTSFASIAFDPDMLIVDDIVVRVGVAP